MENVITVRCPSCGTLNRAPAPKAGSVARCGECKAEFRVPTPPAAPVDVTDESFESEVRGSALPALVEFWSPSCGHCVRMGPVMDALAAELGGRMKVAKVDISKNSRVPSQYEIRATPAFLVIKGGREVARLLGAMPKDELVKKIHPFI